MWRVERRQRESARESAAAKEPALTKQPWFKAQMAELKKAENAI